MMKGLHAWLTKKNASQVGVVAVVAVAVVAVTSVQPTSEKRTLPQLSASAAETLAAPSARTETAAARRVLNGDADFILLLPL